MLWRPTRLKVYTWGVRIGPNSKMLAFLGCYPRVDIYWNYVRCIRRSRHSIRFLRDGHADLTFWSLTKHQPIVEALKAMGMAIE